MPIPKPEGEDEKTFMSRCMSDAGMQEYPDTQRAAICFKSFRGEKLEGMMANVCGVCNWIVEDPKEVKMVCPSCGAKAFFVPILHSMKREARRDPDFDRIHGEFVKYYCKTNDSKASCQVAEDEYNQWIRDLSLDETKPYGRSQEKFTWLKNMIRKYKEDKDNVYYKVLVAFPIRSMNENTYYQNDLVAFANTLVGVPVNINHKTDFTLEGVTYDMAQFEDGAVEASLKVPRETICPVCGGDKPVYKLIDERGIVNVSLEGSGTPFRFTGCALLTSDTLPGIPLARIFPLEETLQEAFSAPKTSKGKQMRLTVTGVNMRKRVREAKVKTEVTIDEVPVGGCPDGYELDVNGRCVPKPEGPPEHNASDVSVGTPASSDTSGTKVTGEATYDWDTCIQDRLDDGYDMDSAKNICGAIKAGTVVHAMFMSMAKTEAEAVELLKKKLREDKIFGSLISKIGELTSTNPDLSVELSTLRVSNKNLNAKISGLETSKLETERNLAEETKARITSDGRILELEKQVRKLDETLAVYRQDKNTDEVSLKQWKRKTEDADERIKTLTEEKAKLVQDIGEVRKQYNDTLTQNLEFSKKLTSANEQILGIEKEKETLTEKLKSSKRLAKRIVAKV